MQLHLNEILTVPERISERILGKSHVFCLRSIQRPVYVQAESETHLVAWMQSVERKLIRVSWLAATQAITAIPKLLFFLQESSSCLGPHGSEEFRLLNLKDLILKLTLALTLTGFNIRISIPSLPTEARMAYQKWLQRGVQRGVQRGRVTLRM